MRAIARSLTPSENSSPKSWCCAVATAVVLWGLVLTPTDVSAQDVAGPTSRLAWDQEVSAGQTIGDIQHQLAVDDGPWNALDRICNETPPSGSTHVCEAALPPLTVGVHVLRVRAQTVVAGITYSSASSDPLSITFIALVTPRNVRLIVVPPGNE